MGKPKKVIVPARGVQRPKGVIGDQPLGVNDVLFGRGTGISSYRGNINFRCIVLEYKQAYNDGQRNTKRVIAEKVVSRIRDLDPPGRFLEQGEDQTFHHVRCYSRILEKACQALREKSCGSPAVFIVKHKKAERKVKSLKRQSAMQTNKEEQQTEKAKARGRVSDKSNEALKKAPPAKRASGSREEKVPNVARAHKTPVKIKKTSTPKAKKRTHKVKASIHSKDRLPGAKKALFEHAEPLTLNDTEEPRIVSTTKIPIVPFSEENVAVQAKLSTHAHIGRSALVASIIGTGSTAMPSLPPHLSAFLGAVFQPRLGDLRCSTPVDAVCIESDPWEFPACVISAHGTVDAGAAVNAASGLVVPAPPRLEANHSFAGYPHEDLEVINEFDPVAAWNSFAEQKKEQW